MEEIVDSIFERLYKRQEEFENLLISKGDWSNRLLHEFDKKQKTKFSKELAFLLFLEVAEFMGAVGNYKSHKTQEDGKDEKEIKVEIVDMFIFVMDMALTHNMTAAELLEEVRKKQEINFERQATGY
jgi:NTP pyrophosphatase (non-canonical NTP hydrolase)